MQTRMIRSGAILTITLLAASISHADDLKSVSDYAAGVCDGTTESVAFVTNAIARANAADTLNAIITLDADVALKAATEIDSADDAIRCKPLAGVPIVV